MISLNKIIVTILAICIILVGVIPAFAQVDIHVMFQTGGDMIPAVNFKEEYEANNPGIKITLEEVPSESLYEKQMTEFLTGTGSYDLIELYPTWMGDYIPFVENLDPFFEKYADDINVDDYIEGAQVGFDKWEGSWYAVPYDGDVVIFYYRKDLFEDPAIMEEFKATYGRELQVPNTWDEVLDCAEFFTRENFADQDQFYGIAMIASRHWWAVGYWSNVYRSYGGEFFDENGEIALNREAFTKANEIWAEMIRFAPPGVLNFGYTETKEALASGQVAMALQWATTVFVDPRQSKVHDRLGFTVMPGVLQEDGSIYRTPALACGKCLAIPKSAKNKEEAFKFAAFLSSPEVQVWSTVNGTGIDPNRYSVFEDPRVIEVWGDLIPVFRESLRIGKPDIKVKGSSKYYDVISAELSNLWAGQQDANRCFDNILREWEMIKSEIDLY